MANEQSIDQVMRRAMRFHHEGMLSQAEALYCQVLQTMPDHPDALHLLGVVCGQTNRPKDAVNLIKQAIAAAPGTGIFRVNLGNTLFGLGRLDEAVDCLRQAVRLMPGNPQPLLTLGAALNKQGQFAQAADCLRKVTQLQPNIAQAHGLLGDALASLNQFDAAVASLSRAIQIKPDYVEACINLSIVLGSMGRFAESLDCSRRVVQLKPDCAEAHINMGNALKELGKLAEAIDCYQRGVQLKPDCAETYYNLGNILKNIDRLPEAIDCYRRALRLKPDYTPALGQLVHLLQRTCIWDDLTNLSRRTIEVSQSDAPTGLSSACMVACTVPTTAHQQLHIASILSDRMAEAVRGVSLRQEADSRPRIAGSKITIGYISADFRQHAVASLTAELFEKHDRDRFAVYGYSICDDDGSAMRRRLATAFDKFVDLKDSSYLDAARRIDADGVDILIDLTGYTASARTQILAMRPAPIQVNYLGYPGTMGAPFMDYILVDDFIVPSDQQPFFTEKLVHLPGCYMPGDSLRPIAERTPTRAESGLPEKGFVFCCFNNNHKITPDMFDAWMRLLKAAPNSVLWLKANSQYAPENLRREAQTRGVSPQRLIFAQTVPSLADHMARHRLADVFLDTFPYNAHTTANDALWAGCPVLTLAGQTYVSRVAGSLLRTVGLSDLITRNFDEYERLALRLAGDAAYLADVKARLAVNRDSCGLFDTTRFARGIEHAYATMWEIHASGQPPRAFAVR
jgi:predicted O-linked N-acetylglucosamine transferase (SPINDLY family)